MVLWRVKIRTENPELSIADVSDQRLVAAARATCRPEGLSDADEALLERLDIDPERFREAPAELPVPLICLSRRRSRDQRSMRTDGDPKATVIVAGIPSRSIGSPNDELDAIDSTRPLCSPTVMVRSRWVPPSGVSVASTTKAS